MAVLGGGAVSYGESPLYGCGVGVLFLRPAHARQRARHLSEMANVCLEWSRGVHNWRVSEMPAEGVLDVWKGGLIC